MKNTIIPLLESERWSRFRRRKKSRLSEILIFWRRFQEDQSRQERFQRESKEGRFQREEGERKRGKIDESRHSSGCHRSGWGHDKRFRSCKDDEKDGGCWKVCKRARRKRRKGDRCRRWKSRNNQRSKNGEWEGTGKEGLGRREKRGRRSRKERVRDKRSKKRRKEQDEGDKKSSLSSLKVRSRCEGRTCHSQDGRSESSEREGRWRRKSQFDKEQGESRRWQGETCWDSQTWGPMKEEKNEELKRKKKKGWKKGIFWFRKNENE